MKMLKTLRESHHYTQKQLAELLKTTQQTIARWESGKAEPSLSALRELAMIFGTSVDDLLGKNPFSEKVTSTSMHVLGREAVEDGFWGHVGLLLHGQQRTKWFPITLGTVDGISEKLGSLKRDNEWLCVPTLSNRMLAVNPTRIRRIWLLDDGCDAPDDWSDEAKENYSGNPLEFYRGLDARFSYDDDFKTTCSEALQQIIEDFVKVNDLDEEKAHRMLHHTNIYMIDGNTTSYWADDTDLANLVFNIDLGEVPLMIRLDALGDHFNSYYPAASLSVMDMPLIDVMDATKKIHDEL
jgi:transcriptional regulator with XRE-family HTH domain